MDSTASRSHELLPLQWREVQLARPAEGSGCALRVGAGPCLLAQGGSGPV